MAINGSAGPQHQQQQQQHQHQQQGLIKQQQFDRFSFPSYSIGCLNKCQVHNKSHQWLDAIENDNELSYANELALSILRPALNMAAIMQIACD